MECAFSAADGSSIYSAVKTLSFKCIICNIKGVHRDAYISLVSSTFLEKFSCIRLCCNQLRAVLERTDPMTTGLMLSWHWSAGERTDLVTILFTYSTRYYARPPSLSLRDGGLRIVDTCKYICFQYVYLDSAVLVRNAMLTMATLAECTLLHGPSRWARHKCFPWASI